MKAKPLMLSIAGVAFVVLAWLALSGRSRPVEWFLTPDQIAAQALKRGDYRLAAEMFTDPMWRGVALFKAGEFDEAAAAFAQRSTPEAHFNQGNAWLMRGNYESAIEGYDRALTLRPAWTEAEENRDLARTYSLQVHDVQIDVQPPPNQAVEHHEPVGSRGKNPALRVHRERRDRPVHAHHFRRNLIRQGLRRQQGLSRIRPGETRRDHSHQHGHKPEETRVAH